MTVSDAALIEDWRRGRQDAFRELVRRHEGPLLRFAAGLVGSRDAEDVVQEAFLRLAERPPALSEDGGREQLSGWLHAVTRNLCRDVMRAENRRRRRERAVAEHEATSGGMTAVEADDTRAAVRSRLAELPLDQREVLVLRLLGERSYKEIAALTGKKIGTVGWLVSTGLKALASDLAPLLGASGRPTAKAPESLGHARGELS